MYSGRMNKLVEVTFQQKIHFSFVRMIFEENWPIY